MPATDCFWCGTVYDQDAMSICPECSSSVNTRALKVITEQDLEKYRQRKAARANGEDGTDSVQPQQPDSGLF